MSKHRPLLAALTVALLATLTGTPAGAQDVVCSPGDFPCGYQVHDVALARVPRLLHYQARVSQAQLPVGEGLFRKVLVNLKRGQDILCTEEFHDVRVLGSVVNLEIGRNVSCELDEVAAENHELELQVCLGQPDNCLLPIKVGAVPYAIKATHAQHAASAHEAQVAGQAHYGHRAAADRDLAATGEATTGWFDLHTPQAAPGLYEEDGFLDYQHGGFLRWTAA